MLKFGWPNDNKLIIINRLLLAVILLVNGYILLSPLLPAANYHIKTKLTKPITSEYSSYDRSKNQLIIPKLQLKEAIHEGQTSAVLSDGLWLRPNGATPDRPGNSVIAGHRFTYKNPGAPLYNLDKLSVGDKVVVIFEREIYEYKVVTELITDPNDTSVEAPSEAPELTLYTCTPLITAENRLVYKSSLERVIP